MGFPMLDLKLGSIRQGDRAVNKERQSRLAVVEDLSSAFPDVIANDFDGPRLIEGEPGFFALLLSHCPLKANTSLSSF